MTDTTIRICLVAFPGMDRDILTRIRRCLAPDGQIANILQAQMADNMAPNIQLEIRTLTHAPVRCSRSRQIVPSCAHWDGADTIDLLILCTEPTPMAYLPMGLRGLILFASRAGAAVCEVGHGGDVLKHLNYFDVENAYAPSDEPDGFITNANFMLAGPNGVDAMLTHWARSKKWPQDEQDVPPPEADLPAPPPEKAHQPAPALADATPQPAEPASIIAEPQEDTALALMEPPSTRYLLDPAYVPAQKRFHHEPSDHKEDIDMPLANTEGFSSPRPHSGAVGDPALSKMRAIMVDTIDAPIALTEIAEKIGLSPKQLRLRCKKILGTTPAQAYLELRLDHARELVTATALSVADIARFTGFASPSAFTRSYKRAFGQSPREERAI